VRCGWEEVAVAVCEGCGSRADDAHIRRRADRLELAKRFRPVQIEVVFLDAAPPSRIEDYFYSPAKDRSVRSLASRMYFDELAKCVGASSSAAIQEVATLTEFQRRGFFLSYAVECAFEDQSDPQGSLRRLAPTVLKRVQEFYKPSYVVPLGAATAELIRLFGLIGWGERLVLNNGGPFVDPYLGNPQRQVEMGTAFGEKIKKALALLL
jgi:hypothetical protein